MLFGAKESAAAKGREGEVEKRQSEATSDETLSELEKKEKVADPQRNRQDAPAPDGEPEKRNQRDDAGLM